MLETACPFTFKGKAGIGMGSICTKTKQSVLRNSAAVAFGVTVILIVVVILLLCGGRSVLTVSRPLEKADAIVLLAGSFEERMPLALSLYQAGRARQILLTDDGVRRGWSREHQRNLYTTERGTDELVRRGVARQSITALPFTRSGTAYDAVAVREYVVKNNLRSIIIVTSDFHTRRSLWIFQKVLQQVPVTIGIVPACSSSAYSAAVECCKFVYYYIRYGVLGEIPGSPT